MSRVYGLTCPNHVAKRIGRGSLRRRNTIAFPRQHATARVTVTPTTSDRFESIPQVQLCFDSVTLNV